MTIATFAHSVALKYLPNIFACSTVQGQPLRIHPLQPPETSVNATISLTCETNAVANSSGSIGLSSALAAAISVPNATMAFCTSSVSDTLVVVVIEIFKNQNSDAGAM